MRDLKKHSYYWDVYKKKVKYPDVKEDIIKINVNPITITFD
jgi:hypothetical protein